jgi:hypothetical protein
VLLGSRWRAEAGSARGADAVADGQQLGDLDASEISGKSVESETGGRGFVEDQHCPPARLVVVRGDSLAGAGGDSCHCQSRLVWAGASDPSGWFSGWRRADSETARRPGRSDWNVADSTADAGGVVNDLGETLDDVEDDGYDATGYAASRRLKQLLRKSRATTGESLGEATTDRVWDLPIAYAVSGTFPAGPPATLALAGDYSMAVLGVRQDLTFELFREGIISDETGKVMQNLMQEDKSAMRVTARYGFAVAVPVTTPEPGAGTPYPFSVLTAAA